jgi:putative transposase
VVHRFQGLFRTGDDRRCDPSTSTDARSRYLLRCQAVARPDEENVRPIFEAAFKEPRPLAREVAGLGARPG